MRAVVARSENETPRTICGRQHNLCRSPALTCDNAPLRSHRARHMRSGREAHQRAIEQLRTELVSGLLLLWASGGRARLPIGREPFALRRKFDAFFHGAHKAG